MMAVCVDPKKVEQVLEYFGHWIVRAVQKVGLNRPEEVIADCLRGDAQVWLAYDGEKVHAAAVTKLVNGVCEIVACGGKGLKQFQPLINDLEQFARDEKCNRTRIIGREGWLRVLDGYEQRAVIIEKDL